MITFAKILRAIIGQALRNSTAVISVARLLNDGLRQPESAALSLQLVSYANGISALVLEMLVVSYRH